MGISVAIYSDFPLNTAMMTLVNYFLVSCVVFSLPLHYSGLLRGSVTIWINYSIPFFEGVFNTCFLWILFLSTFGFRKD